MWLCLINLWQKNGPIQFFFAAFFVSDPRLHLSRLSRWLRLGPPDPRCHPGSPSAQLHPGLPFHRLHLRQSSPGCLQGLLHPGSSLPTLPWGLILAGLWIFIWLLLLLASSWLLPPSTPPWTYFFDSFCFCPPPTPRPPQLEYVTAQGRAFLGGGELSHVCGFLSFLIWSVSCVPSLVNHCSLYSPVLYYPISSLCLVMLIRPQFSISLRPFSSMLCWFTCLSPGFAN